MYMDALDISRIRPISSLPRDYSELAENAKSEGDIVFFKRNSPYVVLLDFVRWQKLIDLERKNEELEALSAIKQSEAEFKAGKAKTLKSLAEL